MWRTETFGEFVKTLPENVPIMQWFEKLMYDWADMNVDNYHSGFINGGVCHTFPVNTSERLLHPKNYVGTTVNVTELKMLYEQSVTP